jgi:hypothetical protein
MMIWKWRNAFGLLAGLLLALTVVRAPAQVVLNEEMADNRSAVANGGFFPDYIELHNPTGAPVNVGGWSLTDDPLVPQKFILPGGTTVPANGFLLVWADLNFGAPGLHTGFGLGAKGDLVRLYAADGFTVLDEFSFGLQVGDYSMGRGPDGSGAWVLNQPSAGSANTAAVLGEAAQLRINEWMCRPSSGDDWLEVFNGDDQPIALGGLVITDIPSATPGNRAIPAHSFIAARGFVQFFASDLAQPDADHLDFKLATEGETLTIYAADRATILDRVTFGAQTQNVSQGRAPDGSDNLLFFSGSSVTPGASNFSDITNVVISEVLSHTDPPLEDAIELQNLTASPVDISHWWLSDSSSQPRKFRIPAGTVVPANGFKVFYQAQFDAGPDAFALDSAEGDSVFLSAGDAAGNLTGAQTFVTFGALKNGVSVGRYNGSTGIQFVTLSQRTFGVDNPGTVVQFRQGTGLPNAAPRVGPIVINEIMFYPPDVGGQANTDGEFIELHNPTASIARLYDQLYPSNAWRLREGVTFDFPPGLGIPAGGFLLLVSFDPVANPTRLSTFRATYNVPVNVPIVGPYAGKLSDTGEGLELLEPDMPQGPSDPDPGFVPYVPAERIKYSRTAPWPANAANTGLSLQRRTALDYGNEPLNWVAAVPSAGRANGADADGDGMPNSWENEHELDPNSPHDAQHDTDEDGASNLHEYRAGTDPNDATSAFALTRISREGSGVRLRFHGVQGRAYFIEARGSMTQGSWQSVSNFTVVSATGEKQVLIPGMTNALQFFRMSTPVTP